MEASQQIPDRLVAEAVILGIAHQKIADLQVGLEIPIALEGDEAEGEDELEAHLQLAEGPLWLSRGSMAYLTAYSSWRKARRIRESTASSRMVTTSRKEAAGPSCSFSRSSTSSSWCVVIGL